MRGGLSRFYQWPVAASCNTPVNRPFPSMMQLPAPEAPVPDVAAAGGVSAPAHGALAAAALPKKPKKPKKAPTAPWEPAPRRFTLVRPRHREREEGLPPPHPTGPAWDFVVLDEGHKVRSNVESRCAAASSRAPPDLLLPSLAVKKIPGGRPCTPLPLLTLSSDQESQDRVEPVSDCNSGSVTTHVSVWGWLVVARPSLP